MNELKNYIDGEWVDAAEGGRFDVVNPATGETIATAPDSSPRDAERAIDAARTTFDERGWPRTPERERGRILLRAADIVRRELERLAQGPRGEPDVGNMRVGYWGAPLTEVA
jgi:betaine-aldehyde dehydrogenase